jgi:trehalose 6-phosphate phosphatase
VSETASIPDALDNRESLARWLDEAAGVVLGLDFDGTLAPIVGDPKAASATPAARQIVERLAARPGVATAVVTGRARDDIRELFAVPGMLYAGNHGLELAQGDRERDHPEAADIREAVAAACADLEHRLADVPGCRIENKGVTATVHVRETPSGEVDRVEDAVAERLAETDDLAVEPGRRVFEIHPTVPWDKGRVVDLLARSAPDGWRTLYLGDDASDEAAFRVLGADGLGVRVRGDGEGPTRTDADYQLSGQTAVPRFLEWLDLRAPSTRYEGDWPGENPLDAPTPFSAGGRP